MVWMGEEVGVRERGRARRGMEGVVGSKQKTRG